MKRTLRHSEPFVLNNLQQLRALADPLRQRIFECLADGPRTVKVVADSLGVKLTSLYHHFRVLERAGLIKKVRSRKIRGTVERHYQAVAQRILLDPVALGGAATALEPLVSATLQSTIEEIAAARRNRRAGSKDPFLIVNRIGFKASPARIRQLTKRIEALIAECEASGDGPHATDYGMTIVLYESAADNSEI